MAWRQADALQDAGIERTYALSPLLTMIDSGGVQGQPQHRPGAGRGEPDRPAPDAQAARAAGEHRHDHQDARRPGAGAGDRGGRQHRDPSPCPSPEGPCRNCSPRCARPTTAAGKIAGLFREGEAKAQALNMKRADGHAMMVGGDRDQVVARRSPISTSRGATSWLRSGSKRGITCPRPTNEDVAEISRAIRRRLKARGEIGGDGDAPRAIVSGGERTTIWPSPPAIGCGCSGAPGARSTAEARQVGNNGDVVEVLGQNDSRPAHPHEGGRGGRRRVAAARRPGDGPAHARIRARAHDRRRAGDHLGRAHQRAAAGPGSRPSPPTSPKAAPLATASLFRRRPSTPPFSSTGRSAMSRR